MPVSTLVNLEELCLDCCTFESSEPLAQLTGLKKLSTCSSTIVASFGDVGDELDSRMCGMPFLNTDTDAAAFLPHMRHLNVLECGLRCHELPNLVNLASTLTEATLMMTRVTDLSPLSCIARLEKLCINSPGTTTLQPLTALTRMSRLCAQLAVSSVTPLMSLRSTLRSLYVHSSRDVHDWVTLAYMTNLTSLEVHNATILPDAQAIKSLKHGNLKRFVYGKKPVEFGGVAWRRSRCHAYNDLNVSRIIEHLSTLGPP
jgi:hypothetical protein